MVRAVVDRFVTSLLVILGSCILVFSILYLLPGDPVDSILDPSTSTPEMIANLRHQLGVDQPFHVQFLNYFGKLLQGDFGKSLLNADPVLPKIWVNFPPTLALTLVGSAISVIIGVLLGVLSVPFIGISQLISSRESSDCSAFPCPHSGREFCCCLFSPFIWGGCLQWARTAGKHLCFRLSLWALSVQGLLSEWYATVCWRSLMSSSSLHSVPKAYRRRSLCIAMHCVMR